MFNSLLSTRENLKEYFLLLFIFLFHNTFFMLSVPYFLTYSKRKSSLSFTEVIIIPDTRKNNYLLNAFLDPLLFYHIQPTKIYLSFSAQNSNIHHCTYILSNIYEQFFLPNDL
jgi:hypothetical protein